MVQSNSNYDADSGAERKRLRVRDLPETLQPRELMQRFGAASVSDDILLAIILRAGTTEQNVLDLAREVLTRFGGSLAAMADASESELMEHKGIGRVKAQVIKAAVELARRSAKTDAAAQDRLNTPSAIVETLQGYLHGGEQEEFWAVALDVRNRLKQRPINVSRGLLDASLVHPREVFREAVRVSAAAVVVAHTHPSGDPAPSAEDLRVTRELIRAGEVVGIQVLDHVIIGRGGRHCSIRESGLVKFG